jgi:hypothetical protein
LVLFAATENAPAVTRKQFLTSQRIPGQAALQVETTSGPLRMVPYTEIGDSTYRTYLTVS